MLDVLLADYIRTARSKGLREATILFKHALRNTLVSIVTLVGIYINVLLASSVMLEVVFSRPGLGRMILGAIKQYDYQVLQSTILVFAALISFVNLLVDLSYCIINPNIRLE
jgi:ABC-type dipeptide/oligopeptide/nickel transport system permease component